MPIERFVHLPEPPLFRGRLGRHRRRAGTRVDGAARKVPEDESQFVAQPLPQFFDNRQCVQAIRAFVIAIFDQRDRRIGRANGMIRLRYRNG